MTKHGGKSIVQRVRKEWCLIAVWGKHDAPCLIPMGQAIKEMLLLCIYNVQAKLCQIDLDYLMNVNYNNQNQHELAMQYQLHRDPSIDYHSNKQICFIMKYDISNLELRFPKNVIPLKYCFSDLYFTYCLLILNNNSSSYTTESCSFS